MGRVARFAGHLGGLLALLHLPLQTAAGPKLDPTVYPPPDTFRQLQQAVLACGRENTAELCGTARLQADPLLDHPRLPSLCKDVLWRIRQKAVVGAANDFGRRDQLDTLSRQVTAICSPAPKPKANAEDSGSGSGPGRSGGLRLNLPGQR